MPDKLKPCPHCGSTDSLEFVVTQEFKEPGWGPHYVVGCECCEICGPTGSSKEDAAKHWNHRPIEDANNVLLREIEATRDAMNNACRDIVEKGEEGYGQMAAVFGVFRDYVNEILSRIPAEPAPCQGCAEPRIDIEEYYFSVTGKKSTYKREAENNCNCIDTFYCEGFVDWLTELFDNRCTVPGGKELWAMILPLSQPVPCPTCADLKAGIVERDDVLDRVDTQNSLFQSGAMVCSDLANGIEEILATRPATDKPESEKQ